MVCCLLCCALKVQAQYSMGNTGLLNIPTADMQEAGTFMGSVPVATTGASGASAGRHDTVQLQYRKLFREYDLPLVCGIKLSMHTIENQTI